MRYLLLVLAFLVSCSTQALQPQPDNLFPRVKFTTSAGDIVVELNRSRAPLTVENFLTYVQSGSYNETIFHRIIPGFVVQGGGYDVEFNERTMFKPIPNESGNGLLNQYGTIAMARMSEPHSATRQFYFNVNDNESLNPSSRRWGYTVFGSVVEGMEVLEQMATVETRIHEQTGWPDVPKQPPVLLKVELLPAS
ncbi:peptidyl-prolyl cis-trans isomerase A (cyclophilin A) [Pseudidiomarina indica]|uniref:Peptidyl-prolyl cis-trans isomerase n=1 Tax=Pseudidiomarina indica TaxID=1159017 RepID=A0A1G6C6H6_9GAMM|nr:peptidylprolyl isomerase [Pseudidiomarina indica]SDB28424.1 peptidyl-prolyl cis-trans isomerase A (cyclophilin A) [Pseudidiomarina indica]